MTPEMQKELLARLDALAAKLGVTADALWSLYLHQAHIEGIQDAIVAGVFGLLFVISLGIVVASLLYAISDDFNDGFPVGCGIAGIVGTVGAAIAGSTYAFAAYSELYNPGFWAFSQLVSHLGK
jgi:hypothetical protein